MAKRKMTDDRYSWLFGSAEDDAKKQLVKIRKALMKKYLKKGLDRESIKAAIADGFSEAQY